MTPESRLLNQITRHLRQMKQAGQPICWRKVHGSGMAQAGEPDLDVVYRGVAIKVELKAGNNKTTALQERRLYEWATAGAVAAVVRSKDEMLKLLEQCHAVDFDGGTDRCVLGLFNSGVSRGAATV